MGCNIECKRVSQNAFVIWVGRGDGGDYYRNLVLSYREGRQGEPVFRFEIEGMPKVYAQ